MRYARAVGFGFCAFAVLFPLFMLASFTVRSLIFPALVEWFPRTFSIPNFVNDREGYEALYALLGLISGMIFVLFVSYISVRFDNERMEFMVAKTEGMYTYSEGLALYYPRYISADILASVLIPLPLLLVDKFILPMLDFIPYDVMQLINDIFLSTRAFTDFGGAVFGYIILAFSLFFARMICGLWSVNAFRALWLSDVEYMG